MLTNASDNRIGDFTGDYENPGEGGILKLGYKLSQNRSEFDTQFIDIDPVTRAQVVMVPISCALAKSGDCSAACAPNTPAWMSTS